MIIEFMVSVEIPDPKDNDLQNEPELLDLLDAVLATMKDEANKSGLSISSASWEAYD